MKHSSKNQAQEVLAGLVERATYHNIKNGFCVLRAKARGHRDVVTVVGHAATIAAGEWITASGEWINDRTHGQQFKARFLRTSPPTSVDRLLLEELCAFQWVVQKSLLARSGADELLSQQMSALEPDDRQLSFLPDVEAEVEKAQYDPAYRRNGARLPLRLSRLGRGVAPIFRTR